MRKLLSVLIILTLAVFLVGAVACKEPEPEKLPTPTITLNGNEASWETIEGATKYEISLNGSLSYLENAMTSKTLENGQSFKIRAIGDGKKYSDSDWSNTVTYVDNTPAVKETFTVTWKNGESVLEIDTDVEYGAMPMYNGVVPTKTATAEFTYVFTGWSPMINAVTGDVTYTAQFSENVNSYTVTFFMDDGVTVLGSKTVPYGSDVIYDGAIPTKAETEACTYSFSHWTSAPGGTIADNLTNVTENRRVYAYFEQTVKTVNVIVTVNNTAYGEVSQSIIENVPYGTSILVSGSNVIIGTNVITATPKGETTQYTFDFTGWSAPQSVGSQTIIEAKFERKLNTYEIVWKNGSAVLEIDEAVAYGTTPTYNGPVPTKASEGDTEYVFAGWTPQVGYVNGDAVYSATFIVKEPDTITVIFYDEDGTSELDRVFIKEGETVEFTKQLPTKEGTANEETLFEMWVTTKGGSKRADLTNITKDTAVYAKYKTVTRTFKVEFYDYDGAFIEVQSVEIGGSAQLPSWTPSREGYKFIGWSADFSVGTSDLVIKALYEKDNTVKVTFIDKDGNVLSEQRVEIGKNATPPNAPSIEGYDQAWDKSFTGITEETVIQATYTLKKYEVTFKMPDGELVPAYCDICDDFYKQSELENGACPICQGAVEDLSVQEIEHGYCAIAPKLPYIYVEGVADAAKVYELEGFDVAFDKITGKTTVTVVKGASYEKPVIIIDIDEGSKTATLYVCKGQNVYLDALELSISYKLEGGGIITIDEAKTNSASPLKNNQSVVNNAEKTFSFAWVYNNEENSNDTRGFGCSKVITFTFSTDDGAQIERESFRVNEDVIAIIAGENDAVTPYVIYR